MKADKLPTTPAVVDFVGDDAMDAPAQVGAGLLRQSATIEPKFLYDPLGAALFEAITRLPEYPLARAEAAVVAEHRQDIVAAIRTSVARPELVDLGAGDCRKARTWIEALRPSRYTAVDFSTEGLSAALRQLTVDYPWLALCGVRCDFTSALRLPDDASSALRVALYPGSSIGNFSPASARSFLSEVRTQCPGGLLIGVDLVKPAARLNLAYDDPLGVTAAFNRNVLLNVNRLLDADFRVQDWVHRASYDHLNRRVRMHLEAACDVVVRWPGGSRRFVRGERIHTEDSYKWDLDGLRDLLAGAGYAHQRVWSEPDWGFAVAWACD